MESGLDDANMSLFFQYLCFLSVYALSSNLSSMAENYFFQTICFSHSLLTDILETDMKMNCSELRCWRAQGTGFVSRKAICWSRFREGEASQGQQAFIQANTVRQDLGEPQFCVSTIPFPSMSPERRPARIWEPKWGRDYEFGGSTWEGKQTLHV